MIKQNKKLTIIIDIAMYLLMLAQMAYALIGNNLHEIMGIALFVLLICHVVIKWKVFATIKAWKKKTALRKMQDVITVLLIIVMLVLALSSMGVSRLLFPDFKLLTDSELHRYLATAALTLSAIHGGMHVLLRTSKKKKTTAFIVIIAIACVAVGLYLVPYLNRHFKVVKIVYADAVEGEKVEWKGSKPLAVYFTRVGNTDFEDDVDAVSGASLLLADGKLMGNTELLADMIKYSIDCDVKAITLTKDKYPSSYSDTVSVAGKELKADARPEIEKIDVQDYENVILVYPLWWGTIPMPVATFLEENDWSGKHLYLIATQGSSGFGSSVGEIEKLAKGAEVTEVMSIYCDDIPYSREKIVEWIKGR